MDAAINEVRPKQRLDEVEAAIEQLRIAYDKYFAGIDRMAPVRQRERVERQVRELERLRMRSTALRFRMDGLRARFITYKHYWNRIEREIERGVSRRDLMRRRAGLGAGPPAQVDAEVPSEHAPGVDPAQRQPGSPPPPPPPKAGDPVTLGLDPRNLRDVFRALVAAKRAAGESVQGLTYAQVCRRLAQEAPRVRASHRCDRVWFDVDTVDGKVRLRGRPA